VNPADGQFPYRSFILTTNDDDDDDDDQVKVEEQTLTLCFPTPIWRLEFSDYESVNAAIREELEQLDWDAIDERQRRMVEASHTFSEDRFITVDQAPSMRAVLDFFVSACNAIGRERNWDMREQEVTLQNYWVHATPPGELTQFHDHKPALLSGV
jgi:hypothetical protein